MSTRTVCSKFMFAGIFLFGGCLSAASDFLVPSDGFTVEGCFDTNRAYGNAVWTAGTKTSLPQFASCPSSPANSGIFRTAWFHAPAVLRFYVAGFPASPGIRLYLENYAGTRTLELRSTVNPAVWLERDWTVPG